MHGFVHVKSAAMQHEIDVTHLCARINYSGSLFAEPWHDYIGVGSPVDDHRALWRRARGRQVERLERFYGIHQLMAAGKCLQLRELMERFEVSKATMKRDIEYLRDRLQAPLVFDRNLHGYRYDHSLSGGERYELPGVWFSPREIHALVAAHAMLCDVGPGLLEGVVGPVISRIERLLEDHKLPSNDVPKRIRILSVGHRASPPRHFSVVAMGVLQRQQLELEYYARGSKEVTQREVSPQRLIHYRGTWYLDAWCHLRNALRSFALDSMRRVSLLKAEAMDQGEAELDKVLASSYGIFSGEPVGRAVLLFSPEASNWVRDESWHPEQIGEVLGDGTFRLEFPYGNYTELVMDILRQGSNVRVVAPLELRERVEAELASMTKIYESK